MSFGFKPGGDHCCAVGCNHKRSNSSCSFLSFPKNKKWYDIWVRAVNRCEVDENGKTVKGKLWKPKSHHRLCACHFSNPPTAKKRLLGWNHIKPDLIGTGNGNPKARSTERSRNRPFTSNDNQENVSWPNFIHWGWGGGVLCFQQKNL